MRMSEPEELAIEIVVPEIVENEACLLLRKITEAIERLGFDISGGLLGGEYGYGADYRNDVFRMFPFYWGDCTCGAEELRNEWENRNAHGDGCYQVCVANDLRKSGFVQASFTNSPAYVEAPEGMGYDESRTIEEDAQKRWCRHFSLSYPHGCAVHCTCGHDAKYREFVNSNPHNPNCPIEMANFHHFESGLKICWYKYIGRGMDYENPNNADIPRVLAESLESVK